MNYPIWETTYFGGGAWIALVAVLHVYISHLAVGGGLFIWLLDRKAWRENNAPLHDYLRRHTWFFLYLTMVFGGVSGVGIWFIIAQVNPAGTSLLIHNFVFGWAIEWVFFLAEIVALLLYAYRFQYLDQTSRQRLAFFYALFAWLSLFIINGILTFMLTPGRWLETRNFWDGFLNPTFWPALGFRTAMAVTIAGLFGYVTSMAIKGENFRTRMLRYCSRWLLYPMPAAALSLWWYYLAVPESTRQVAFGLNRGMAPFVMVFAIASAGLFLGGIFFVWRSGLFIQRLATVVVVAIGLSWIGGFEYIREIARKPFLIPGYLYANSILVSQLARLDQQGFLNQARWTAVKAVSPANLNEAGRELFNLQCLGCHTVGGLRNNILRRTAHLTYAGILAQLNGQGRILNYMPPVMGTRAEKEALAVYIAGLGGKEVRAEPEPYTIKALTHTVLEKVPPAKDQDQYVLMAWSELGMRYISDGDPWFAYQPPGTTLEAQLIKCGLVPELVGAGVELVYRVERGFENPAAQVPFWEFVQANYQAKPEKNVGLTGNGMSGKFIYDTARKSYAAKSIPVVPYPEGGGYNPYPLFTVEARDQQSGRLLAAVNVVAPVTTEMGCRNCHGGGWRVAGAAGWSQETANNILQTHDRINGTDLFASAAAGKPRLCQSCHADSSVGAPGKAGVLNFSAAMHGWHANYMHAEGADACAFCHASDRQGPTRCNRGIHAVAGLTCVDCHGTLSDHALALLKGQADLPAAGRLMKDLAPVKVSAKEMVKARSPWINEPDCLSCHEGFQPPKPGVTAYNRWNAKVEELYRNRADEGGVRCPACHGATHAEYPALNPYQPLRDILQPMQITGKPYPVGSEQTCVVCHLEKMEDPIHHTNMLRAFRSQEVWSKAMLNASPAGGAK
jgi:mono/diheme cytochrome c family protein